MGVKVSFDPVNKFIIVNSGISELNVQVDIYSDAKEDWRTDSNLQKFQFPFRPIGGDSITVDKIVTPRYFLLPPWVIKPDERNHELLITGDLFSDAVPPSSLTTPASGNFTVAFLFNRTFDALTTTVTQPVVVPSAVDGGGGGQASGTQLGLVASFVDPP
jgi:hypothetical protein